MFSPSVDWLSLLAGQTPAWVPGGESWDNLSAQPGAPWDACRADKVAPFVTTDPSPEEQLGEPPRRRRKRRRPASTRRKFDEIARGQLLAMVSVGVSQREAAASLGLSHTTVSKAQRRDAEFAARLQRAAVQGFHSQRWRGQLAIASPIGQATAES